ncbi:TPA: Arc family DNA-binding protein [Escherichia coli]|nr:Arc family DNA-binding protein [Escherichia coli]
MPTPKPKTITFRLSDELLEDLKRLAEDEGRSINSMLTELVKRAAKKQDGESK